MENAEFKAPKLSNSFNNNAAPVDKRFKQPITLSLPDSVLHNRQGMGAVKQDYVPHALHAVPGITRAVSNPEIKASGRLSARRPQITQRDLWWLGDRALNTGIKINVLCPNGPRKDEVEKLLRESPQIRSNQVRVINTSHSKQRQLGTPRNDKQPTLMITSNRSKPQSPHTIQMDLLSDGYFAKGGSSQDLYSAVAMPQTIIRTSELAKTGHKHKKDSKHVRYKQREARTELWLRDRKKISLSAGSVGLIKTESKTPTLPTLYHRSPSENSDRPVSELSLPAEEPVPSPRKLSARGRHKERKYGWQQWEGSKQAENSVSQLRFNQINGTQANQSLPLGLQQHTPNSPPTDPSTQQTVEKTKANNQVHILNIGAGVKANKSANKYMSQLLQGTKSAAYEKAKEIKMKEKIHQANLSLSQYFCVSVGGVGAPEKPSPEPKAAFEASILEVQGAEIISKPKKVKPKDKRNVRFSLNTKVHEYTPRSPLPDGPP